MGSRIRLFIQIFGNVVTLMALPSRYSLYIVPLLTFMLTCEIFLTLSKHQSIAFILIKFKKKVGKVMSYLIVGFIGAILAMSYWYGAQRIFIPKQSPPTGLKVSPPSNLPQQPPEKASIPPEQPKPLTKEDLKLALDEFKKSLTSPQEITNKQICLQTMDLVKRIHKFAHDRKERSEQLTNQQMDAMRAARYKTEEEKNQIWQKYTILDTQQRNKEQYEFMTTILGEAIYLKDELLRRLPSEPKPNKDDYPFHVFEGSLAGPYPEEGAAGYLESLARKLCP